MWMRLDWRFVWALLFSCGCAVSTESESVGETEEGVTTDTPPAVAPHDGSTTQLHMKSCAFPSSTGACFCPGWFKCDDQCCPWIGPPWL